MIVGSTEELLGLSGTVVYVPGELLAASHALGLDTLRAMLSDLTGDNDVEPWLMLLADVGTSLG